MARPIVMPSLGMYTAEGTLVEWLFQPGASVTTGAAIAMLETEKATYELQASEDGLLHPIVTPGTVLPVEGILGYILAPGEAAPGATAAIAAPVEASEAAASSALPLFPNGIKASPIAKRIAREHGVDLARIRGSGPGGRIVEADVLVAIAEGRPASSTAKTTAPPAAGPMRIPLTGMRGTIADRLRHSLSTAASLTLTSDTRVEALVSARRWLRPAGGDSIPFDALFIKVFAWALRQHPALNATVEERTIVRLESVNIGFAVALPEGLIVPVVKDADRRPLLEIATEVRQMTERARTGSLRPDDVSGGTASISNLGGYGIDAFTPILNPPQAVMLGIGRIAARAVVEQDRIVPGQTCVLSLTFDHRVADGAPAAQLLAALTSTIADEAKLESVLRG